MFVLFVLRLYSSYSPARTQLPDRQAANVTILHSAMETRSFPDRTIAFENARIQRMLLLLLLGGRATLYAQGLSIGCFGDDFQYIFARPAETIWRTFIEPNPVHPWYRPLSSALIAATQALVG